MEDVQRQGPLESPPVATGYFRWPDAEFSQPFFQYLGSCSKMLMDCNDELFRFWNDRIHYDVETSRAIVRCAEWPKVVEIEQAWLRTTAEDYLNETRRLMDLNSAMTETVLGTVQRTDGRAPVAKDAPKSTT
jgi:hypothetical protein